MTNCPGKGLLPGEHLVDSGYPSAELITHAALDPADETVAQGRNVRGVEFTTHQPRGRSEHTATIGAALTTHSTAPAIYT